jgi:hypothetical protein
MKRRNQARRAPNEEPGRDASPERRETGTGSEASRLSLIGVKVDIALRREIDAYAEAQGVSRSRAASRLLAIARDAIREREGVPGSRADELLEALDGLRASVDILGPPTFGILRLLAHWATHGGGVKVNEDELLAELRTVGADEWEQAVAEAERDLEEAPEGDSGNEKS